MSAVLVTDETLQEGRNIVDGVYAPLRGFLYEEELHSVLDRMRLPNGAVWPLPVVLDVDEETAARVDGSRAVVLRSPSGGTPLVVRAPRAYTVGRKALVRRVFGTDDERHPGVARFLRSQSAFLGGTVAPAGGARREHPHVRYLRPADTQRHFRERGFNTVAGFQTRNPPHRSHEHLHRRALEAVDGLFIQPLIGWKKSGDIRDEHILGTYELLIRRHYPSERVLLGTLHTFMRYAGPREAVFHALIRRNFGCTHMIIGRDHAGTGRSYGPYDAQRIFMRFSRAELGITILPFQNASYCRGCRATTCEDECPHPASLRLDVSATHLRRLLRENHPLPVECIREEIAAYLARHRAQLFVA